MIKKIDIPIFFGTLVLFQDYDIEKACAIAEFDYDPENKFDAYAGISVDKKGNTGFVIIFAKCTPEIIAHEATHVANRICERNEMEKDEELIAYLTGWVVTQCHKYLKVE